MIEHQFAHLARRVARIEKALASPILPAIETPPEPAPEPAAFNALACYDNTANENKLVRLPQLRRERLDRVSTATIGDVTEWPQGGLTKENLESIVPQGYAQWSSNLHKKKLEAREGIYFWKNVGVSAASDARQLKWGTREYNAPHRVFLDCDFTQIWQEHGLYVSNSGNTGLDRCTFLMCGSQGAQWAHRAMPYQQYSADNMPYTESPLHQVRDSHFVDCAYQGTRPSFNLTYFQPGTSAHPGFLRIEDSSFVSNWKVARNDGCRSTGALVVTPGQGNLPLYETNMMREVVIRNCLFDFTKGDRSLIAIRSADKVVFEDCLFIARDHDQPFITIDKEYNGALGGTKTTSIEFTNCRSKGVVLNILLATGLDGKQVSRKHSIDCPDRVMRFDGQTGDLVFVSEA